METLGRFVFTTNVYVQENTQFATTSNRFQEPSSEKNRTYAFIDDPVGIQWGYRYKVIYSDEVLSRKLMTNIPGEKLLHINKKEYVYQEHICNFKKYKPWWCCCAWVTEGFKTGRETWSGCGKNETWINPIMVRSAEIESLESDPIILF